jgi:RNase adaptor protein for sRNA GlmZ degradation
MALRNLKEFIAHQNVGITVPEFRRVLEICISDDIIERFMPLKANELTPLVVRVNSFSYKKGIPEDISGNGGGFVFDCRGILNPGRIEQYKAYHGKDKEVRDFLEQQTRMIEFLNSVFDIVDITVEDYIKRGRTALMISFGCTGGQHRSVYAAEALSRHLKNKFGVRIEIAHIEQEARQWINQ